MMSSELPTELVSGAQVIIDEKIYSELDAYILSKLFTGCIASQNFGNGVANTC